jgi:hypothetical protein
MKKVKNWDEASNLESDYLIKVVKPLLPNAKYNYIIQFEDFHETSDTFNGALSSEEIFKNSNYEYKEEERFLHFTSLTNLDSIIKSGHIRMSDFTNLSDKSELNYASLVFETGNEYFNINKEIIDEEKRKLFCLSVCKNSIETIQNTFMWNEYGNKGTGVIIDFSLNCSKSNRFSIGHIKYGKNELEVIKDLKQRFIDFADKNTFRPNNPVQMITLLLAYHKSLKYASENELRILFNDKGLELTNIEYPTIDSTINKHNQKIRFNKIFLKGRNPFKGCEENLFPEIKINRIILGYNLSYEEKADALLLFNKLKEKYSELDFDIYHMNDDLELNNCNIF